MAAPTIDTWNPNQGITLSPEQIEAATLEAEKTTIKDMAEVGKVSWADAVDAEDVANRVQSITINPTAPAFAPSPSPAAAPAPAPSPTPASAGTGDVNPETHNENVSAADLSLMKKILRTRLIESKNNIEIERQNPDSPLHSVKTFEELNLSPSLLKGLYAMNFMAPSKIQETALPILLANPPSNIIAQSQSGTGKTAAFLLSSLHRVDTSLNFPQVLILSPTYELALQTGEVAKTMAKFLTGIRFCYAVRGNEVARGSKLEDHVILGTPGKVMDWALKCRYFDITKIRVFVLDEADVMIDTQGHRQQSIHIQKALSSNTQIMFFSATYNDEVRNFAELIVKNPVIIKLRREEESLENINQFYVQTESEEAKYFALANLFGVLTIGQCFIFCATKRSAAWLAGKLTNDGHAVGLISGELTVEERTTMLERFRDGKERILICTNLMARGIDVEQVTVVINYDLPLNHETKEICLETYLHRIGRTGRFGKHGLAINFVESARTMNMIRKIEDTFKKQIKRLNTDDIESLEKINQD